MGPSYRHLKSPLRVREAGQSPVVLEICAGAGGQALGLEAAGFDHAAAVEIDAHACQTLRTNRSHWKVIEGDVLELNGKDFRGIDLLAGGVPCPPFSVAGKQLGAADERDLFPEAVRLASEAKPRAVMIENVRGFSSERFEEYRRTLFAKLTRLGYRVDWRILNARDFGVPQLRPRFVLVALREEYTPFFSWPEPEERINTVGDAIFDLMSARNWPGAVAWRKGAQAVGPTVVGGSKKHGGPDLGPTRARAQWKELGVDGIGVADLAPGVDHPEGKLPRLTVPMVARIQGFPNRWIFTGGKTASYRQVGNAFPPPVAFAVGQQIARALAKESIAGTADQLRMSV